MALPFPLNVGIILMGFQDAVFLTIKLVDSGCVDLGSYSQSRPPCIVQQ